MRQKEKAAANDEDVALVSGLQSGTSCQEASFGLVECKIEAMMREDEEAENIVVADVHPAKKVKMEPDAVATSDPYQ